MVELVDASDSKSDEVKLVRVRVPPLAPNMRKMLSPRNHNDYMGVAFKLHKTVKNRLLPKERNNLFLCWNLKQ